MKFQRTLAAGAGLLGATTAIAVGAPAIAATGNGRADSGTAYISIVHQQGSSLYAAGYNVDKLFGATAVTYVVAVGPSTPGTFKIKAKAVTLYTRDGALTGTGSATQFTTPSGAETVRDGKLSLTHGTGGQAHHTVTATFSGTYDPKAGAYTFHYKGIYR